jgi:hypothetical protein
MNSDYEKQLEAAVQKELKALPELRAPHSLQIRVMRAIEQRASLPWYRRSWQNWPPALQIPVLAGMLTAFAALCFAGWEVWQSPAFAEVSHKVARYLAGAGAVWNAASVLVSATGLALKQLGTGLVIACIAAIALGYAMCVGLGTVYLRLALARRRN